MIQRTIHPNHPRRPATAPCTMKREYNSQSSSREDVVFFFRYRNELIYDEEQGHWVERQRWYNSSSWRAWYVNMVGLGGDYTLAHEFRHYLQIRHTFVGGIDTVNKAAEKIRAYVEEDGHHVNQGLYALDKDRIWVLDTPADASVISKVSVCSMGVDLVAAAMRDHGGKLRVILYELAANGALVLRRHTRVSSVIKDVKTCRSGHRTFATACIDKDNNFLMAAWTIS